MIICSTMFCQTKTWISEQAFGRRLYVAFHLSGISAVGIHKVYEHFQKAKYGNNPKEIVNYPENFNNKNILQKLKTIAQQKKIELTSNKYWNYSCCLHYGIISAATSWLTLAILGVRPFSTTFDNFIVPLIADAYQNRIRRVATGNHGILT